MLSVDLTKNKKRDCLWKEKEKKISNNFQSSSSTSSHSSFSLLFSFLWLLIQINKYKEINSTCFTIFQIRSKIHSLFHKNKNKMNKNILKHICFVQFYFNFNTWTVQQPELSYCRNINYFKNEKKWTKMKIQLLMFTMFRSFIWRKNIWN